MSEGELKKRFLQKLGKGLVMVGIAHETGWYEKEGYVGEPSYEVVDDVIVFPKHQIIKAFKMLFDEAKQDFPKNEIDTLEGFDELMWAADARLDWFKKWFGDGK